MSKNKKNTIEVQITSIAIVSLKYKGYISLTYIAKYRNNQEPFAIINNWMRGRSTIEFLGLWEKLSNPDFKPLEFERFKSEAGDNYFVLSPQRWVESTHAIGLISKSGRYGGTYAHKDIAFEFASWISSEFKLYLIKEFQRLKYDENRRISLEWNLNRTLSKLNYRIHTDAIKAHLIPVLITPAQAAQPNLFQGEIENLQLPKPQIEEQQRIADFLDSSEAYINRFQTTLRKLRSLKTALMQDLLTGKKRVTPMLTKPPGANA